MTHCLGKYNTKIYQNTPKLLPDTVQVIFKSLCFGPTGNLILGHGDVEARLKEGARHFHNTRRGCRVCKASRHRENDTRTGAIQAATKQNCVILKNHGSPPVREKEKERKRETRGQAPEPEPEPGGTRKS